MTFVATLEPDFRSALEQAVDVLRSLAEFELDADVQRCMRNLSENEEGCSVDQREEHRQLAEFWRKQTLRRRQAIQVLSRLHDAAPDLVGDLPVFSEER